jgi:hypothetical protein
VQLHEIGTIGEPFNLSPPTYRVTSGHPQVREECPDHGGIVQRGD